LAPQPGELVIDMCAAPGGKTIQLAQLMENRGTIVGVEINRDRMRSLRSNITRCGVKNAVLFRMNALDLNRLNIAADRILLDAPCTGEGVIRKDKTRKKSRGAQDVEFCSALQMKLIETAFNCLRSGGTLVYSTCSLAPEENEVVIDYILKKCPLAIQPIDIPIGESAFTKVGPLKFYGDLSLAHRLYPHKQDTEGFFIAKLRKLG